MSMCSKSGCKNNALTGINGCHLKSHNDDQEAYENAIEQFHMNFRATRTPLSDVTVIDVLDDGACCYRALVHGLIANVDTLSNGKKLKEFVKQYDLHNGIISEEKETMIARYLQELARRQISKRRHEVMAGIGYSIGDAVTDSHELESLDEYLELYRIFAGDPDFIMIDPEEDESKKKRKKKMQIPTRWGGDIELHILAQYFNIKISIYVPQRINKRSFKIVPAGLKDSDTYLYLSQVCFPENQVDIRLLLTTRNIAHYQYICNFH